MKKPVTPPPNRQDLTAVLPSVGSLLLSGVGLAKVLGVVVEGGELAAGGSHHADTGQCNKSSKVKNIYFLDGIALYHTKIFHWGLKILTEISNKKNSIMVRKKFRSSDKM